MRNFLDKHKKLLVAVVLGIIIATSLGRIAYLCAFVKEGVHSDEVWSYGLANGYREPYIYTNYMQNEDKYKNKWITGDTLKDYLTVQKGERFDYPSVLYNLKSDNHPPMYFFVLHTICSFFPDVYSRWFGYSINFVVFVIIMIYLYLLAARLSRNRLTGLLVAAAYCFSISGVDTFIFIRHYAMVAMFIVMTVYHAIRLMESEDRKQYVRRLIGLFFIITMGCLTHYEYVPFLAAFGVCMLILYIKRKKWYEMFTFGGICAGCAVVLLLATGIFTRLIMRLTGTDFDGTSNGGSYNDDGQSLWQDILDNVKMTFYDITGAKLTNTGATVFMAVLGALLLGTILFLIIRHRKVKKGLKKPLFEHEMSITAFMWIDVVISVLAFLLFVSATASQASMGVYADRYLFPIYPLITLIMICFARAVLVFIVEHVFKRFSGLTRANIARVLSIAIVVGYLIYNNISSEIYYLFPRKVDNVYMEDVTKGKDVLLYTSETWLLTTYTDLLMNADDIYVADSESYETMKTADLEGKDVEYVVLDATKFYYSAEIFYITDSPEGRRKIIEARCMPIIEKTTGKKFEYVDSDWVFTRRVYIFRAI